MLPAEVPLLLPVHFLQAAWRVRDVIGRKQCVDRNYLLFRQIVVECAEHVHLVLDAQLCAALLSDALLPEHVLGMEYKWLRGHGA